MDPLPYACSHKSVPHCSTPFMSDSCNPTSTFDAFCGYCETVNPKMIMAEVLGQITYFLREFKKKDGIYALNVSMFSAVSTKRTGNQKKKMNPKEVMSCTFASAYSDIPSIPKYLLVRSKVPDTVVHVFSLDACKP